ncbi:MAG: hydrogenase maturation nickel metallochaperone HypA [Candidatus Aureabacteria bacterium]|nr:hydrogenase maturation nickel metallochaperone HypA [Candidatus Auribacterota bacterium]
MHDQSVIHGVLKELAQRKLEHGFSKVLSIELVCGKYSCLSEEHLRFHFATTAKPPWLESAALRIVTRGERLQCAGCAAEFELGNPDSPACPGCGGSDLSPVIDRGVYIGAIEVE